jgi:molecular chaperone GrpE
LNLEKRSREERFEWIRTANKDLITGILPGLDALILAEKHTQDNNAIVAIKHFISELEKEGLKKIETEGKEFDPKSMECIQVIEGEDGMVLEETRPGFVLYDKVIRPAQVIVGKKEN